jgi:hypothetical protein
MTYTQCATDAPFFCIKCHDQRISAPPSITPRDWWRLSQEENIMRLGLLIPVSITEDTIKKKIGTRISAIRRCTGENILSKLQTNTPHTFPRTKPMSPESRRRHTKYGSVLDVALLLFIINVCDCCGYTTPVNDYPNVPEMPKILPHLWVNHLQEEFYPTVKCSCDDMYGQTVLTFSQQ